jgi:DnaJ-class molecular chaperone
MKRDLYEILGVPRSANDDEIRKAYRKLARKYHPDLHPDDKASEDKFKEVAVAHEILGDPEKRKAYDEFGEDALNPNFDPARAREYARWRGSPEWASPGQGADAFGFGGINLDDLFGSLFGGRRDGFGRAMRVRGNDVESTLEIGLADALKGNQVTFTLSGGAASDSTVTVKVPAGVAEGDRIRLAGKGEPGLGGGPPGDLYLKVKLRPHRHLRREGDDLLMTLPVTVPEAVLGASILVPTLEGELRVKVPPGSQAGTKLRLRGKGARDRKSGRKGDLILLLEVRAPDSGGEELQALARSLEAHYRADIRADLKL